MLLSELISPDFLSALLLPSLKLPPPPMFSISAGSLPTLSAQRAAAGLQPHGETGGQRLPRSHCSVLFYSNAGHGCGTCGTNVP